MGSDLKIWLSGNVPSLKNSKIKTQHGIFHSKTCRKYLQSLGIQNYSTKTGVKGYVKRVNVFNKAFKEVKINQFPVKIGLHFVRGTRHRFDFMNASHIIFDLMVAHKILPDDDMDHLIPYPLQMDGQWYQYDKDKPGVWITIG